MKFLINKNERGITLIALIVTIVVLLILAGVTIANISGNESPMENAANVKSDSEKQAIQNKLEMALIAVFNEKGDIDVASVKSEVLQKFSGATVKNNEYPLEVVIDNVPFLINEDTTVAEKIYEKKEYIKSTGTQYIDTGVSPADTIDFEITFKTDVDAMSEGNTGREAFFGANNTDLKRTIQINFGSTIGQKTVFTWKNETYNNGNGAEPKYFYTTDYNLKNKTTISCSNNIWKVNNDITETSASIGSWKDTNNTLVVFGRSSISSNVKNISTFYENMYLYSLKIWDNGKLVRDFIPVVSLANGHENEACLYDLVGGTFYYNQGTGTFQTNT